MISHAEYVRQGHCPATMPSQTRPKGMDLWCFRPAGHDGLHETLSDTVNVKAQYIRWS